MEMVRFMDVGLAKSGASAPRLHPLTSHDSENCERRVCAAERTLLISDDANSVRSRGGTMSTIDVDATTAERLLSRIEVAVGELLPRDGRNATLIKEIIESVNGLRSILGVLRTH